MCKAEAQPLQAEDGVERGAAPREPVKIKMEVMNLIDSNRRISFSFFALLFYSNVHAGRKSLTALGCVGVGYGYGKIGRSARCL